MKGGVVSPSLDEMLCGQEGDAELLVYIYKATKHLFILAEEVCSDEFSSYVAPILEQRDAYDHLIRILDYQTYQEEGRAEYAKQNVMGVISHQYRAFFDTADFLYLELRRQISKPVAEFGRGIVEEVVPEYSADLYPLLVHLPEEIMKLRSDKDIGDRKKVRRTVEEYHTKLIKLRSGALNCQKNLPNMVRLRRRKRWKIRREHVVGFVLGILTSIIGSLCYDALHLNSASPPPPLTNEQQLP